MRLLIGGSQVPALVRPPFKILLMRVLFISPPRTKCALCEVLCVGGRGQLAVGFPLFPYRHPFDSARGSNGQIDDVLIRSIGYWSGQNGRSVLPVAAGYRLLQNENEIVRVGFESLSYGPQFGKRS